MPEYWYSLRGNKIHEEDTDEVKAKKTINERIAATKKPYFMCYVYPKLKSEYNKYVKNNNNSAIRKYGKYGIKCVDDIRNYPAQSPEMSDSSGTIFSARFCKQIIVGEFNVLFKIIGLSVHIFVSPIDTLGFPIFIRGLDYIF